MSYDTSVANLNERSAQYRQLLADMNAREQLMVQRNNRMMGQCLESELWAEQLEASAGGGGTPSPDDDIMNSDGTVNLARRNAVAADYWNALDYRLGKKSATIPNLPTYSKRTPNREIPGGNGVGGKRLYQIGEYKDSDPDWYIPGGDFSSNIEHVLWSPDDPAADLGVTQLQGTSFSNATGTLHPELIWNLYGQGYQATEALFYKQNGYPNLGKFTCMGQALGRPGWATKSLAGTLDGYIIAIGANTMTNKSITRLSAGRIPTAITMTSSCEFALVTYWDVNTNSAGVAFIACCGLGHGMTLANPRPNPAGSESGWWGEWEEVRFGLHNLGNLAAMKVIGYLPLPGMLAPTEISATTGHFRYHYLNGSGVNETTGNTGNWQLSEQQRQRWVSGDYANRYAKQGFAVVISKSEKKAICIDLRPLFAYYNSKYFNTDRNVFLETTNYGLGAGQWPYSFEEQPSQMPQIVKTINTESRPTSVYVFNYCDNTKDRHRQFHIGLENGQMVTYSCGGYAQPDPGNYNPTTLGNPANIAEVGRIFVGRNPTSIQPIKEKGSKNGVHLAGLIRDVTRGLIVCSREEKAGRWIDLGDATYAAVEQRKCQMTQIQDPVFIADTDNHGTESYVALVADPSAKCIHHVVWGGTYFHTYKDEYFPLLNDEPFNYGDRFDVRGRPYRTMSANIS